MKAILYRKECWDTFREVWELTEELYQKIYHILLHDELSARYMSGFPTLYSSEKLDLSLDDIINPIEVGEKKAYRGGCHPGRLTLNPDAYHHAYSMKMTGTRKEVRNYLRCGIGQPWRGKHRLLDIPVHNKSPWPSEKSNYLQSINVGLQHSIYFLGGAPLIYWATPRSMGLQFVGSSQYITDISGFQWINRESLKNFKFYPYLPSREDYGKQHPSHYSWMTTFRKLPRTVDVHGNVRNLWNGRSLESFDRFKDGYDDIYVNKIQRLEYISNGNSYSKEERCSSM